MTTDITIKSEISALAELDVNRQFAATDLIRTRLLCHKASANPDRHVYLSCQVFNRCTEAYNTILELMQTCQEAERLSWDLIDLYMRAISVLERSILAFEWCASSETTQRILLSFDSDNWPDTSRDYFPSEEDVIGCLAFVDTWVQDRHRLIKALQDLRSQQFLVRFQYDEHKACEWKMTWLTGPTNDQRFYPGKNTNRTKRNKEGCCSWICSWSFPRWQCNHCSNFSIFSDLLRWRKSANGSRDHRNRGVSDYQSTNPSDT